MSTNRTSKWEGRFHGILFFAGFIVLISSTFWALNKHSDWWFPPLASEHGAVIDRLQILTLWVTGIAFLITQFGLVYYVLRYGSKGNGKKAYWYPENVRLEL